MITKLVKKKATKRRGERKFNVRLRKEGIMVSNELAGMSSSSSSSSPL